DLGRTAGSRLRVQIRNPVALELRDHVLQHQLPLLQAAEHDLIDIRIEREPRDDLIQVLVLYAQLMKPLAASTLIGDDVAHHESLRIGASQSRFRSPTERNCGFSRLSMRLYTNVRPSRSMIHPPAPLRTACAAAVSHSEVGPKRG